MSQLNKNFQDFIALLNDRKVEYLVVGGYAVAAHGHPRYTGDMDFFVATSRENSGKIVEALEAFGFHDEIPPNYFTIEGKICEIGREPQKIQIHTCLSGIDFNSCYKNRCEVSYHGLTIPFIGYNDLIVNKQAAGRNKDIYDVMELRRTEQEKAKSVDRSDTGRDGIE